MFCDAVFIRIAMLWKMISRNIRDFKNQLSTYLTGHQYHRITFFKLNQRFIFFLIILLAI